MLSLVPPHCPRCAGSRFELPLFESHPEIICWECGHRFRVEDSARPARDSRGAGPPEDGVPTERRK